MVKTIEYNTGYNDYQFYDEKRKRELKVAVWYPTHGKPESLIYLAHFVGTACFQSAIAPGSYPLIVISHGAEGHRYNQYYLAEYLSAHGFVVAAVEHENDTAFANSLTNDVANLWHRPRDINFVIEQICDHHDFKNYLNQKKIGLIGHSFGGYSAFILAGGEPSLHAKNIDLQIKASRKISAIVLLAPALSELFVKENKKITIPTLLIKSGKDELLGNSDLKYLALLGRKQLINLKNAGHFVYLMECPDPVKEQCPLPATDIGTPRHEIHPLLKREITAFLNQYMK